MYACFLYNYDHKIGQGYSLSKQGDFVREVPTEHFLSEQEIFKTMNQKIRTQFLLQELVNN